MKEMKTKLACRKAGMDVNKFQLNTFIATRQVLIYDIKTLK
jgi:hypothetical protein